MTNNQITKKTNGFTLIELLVVISIMSILTVITVSQFMTARAKARDVARKGDLNAVSKALLMYYNDYGVFPDVNAGQISVNGTTKAWGQEFNDTTNYTYMKVLPTENTVGRLQYCYVVDTNKKKFALYASLESTTDVECVGHHYTCNSVANYCYAVVSPNALITDF